jgi:hypothetical protein
VVSFGELSELPITVSAATAFGIFDGMFQQALLRFLAGQDNALEVVRATPTAVESAAVGDAFGFAQ